MMPGRSVTPRRRPSLQSLHLESAVVRPVLDLLCFVQTIVAPRECVPLRSAHSALYRSNEAFVAATLFYMQPGFGELTMFKFAHASTIGMLLFEAMAVDL